MSYHVVGCSECSSLWILNDESEQSAVCPTCETQHSRHLLKNFASREDREEAAQVRSALLAKRAGYADSDFDSYRVQRDQAEAPIVDDRELLEGLGLEDDLVSQLTGEDQSSSTKTDRALTERPDGGPDVDVPVADRPQLRGRADQEAVEPGVSVSDPQGQVDLTSRRYQDITPRTSEWLGDVVEDHISETARLVQDIARERCGLSPLDPNKARGAVPKFVQDELVGTIAQLDDVEADTATVEEARSYLDAVARYALLWADDVYRTRRGFRGKRQFERVRKALATTGTSRGSFNAGVDALRHSFAALHAERDEPLSLTFMLDGREWTAADPETVKRALTVFDVLADGFDVRLWMSPGIQKRVRRLVKNALDTDDDQPPSWAERFEFLTEGRYRSRRLRPAGDDSDASVDAEEAWEIVVDYRQQQGLLCTLANLDPDDERSVRALKRDRAIDYADGSIDRYVSELEASGLVTLDRSHASNRVALTPLGEAAQQFVDRMGNLTRPVSQDQSQLLGASYGHPSASHKYSVSPQETGGDRRPPAERWMAETGDPQEDGYVQFLGDSSGTRDIEPPVLHRRLLAAERVSGVNLADADLIDWTDDDQAPDGDGRVTYASIFDDHALLVTQWGGPAQTLARLCAGLLGNRMLSKALNIDAVGRQFERLYDGVDSFDNDLEDVLQRAQQIGWLSDDQLAHYDNWRDRIGGVRSLLLKKVGDIDALGAEARQQLFKDLQGLLCSATHLYHAAGIDITTNIRMPRVKELKENDEAYQHFLDFIRFTVPKQAGYEDENGFHSIHRMLIEDRSEKLRARAAYDVDESDPTADMTMSWVISGPGVTSLQEDVQGAIAAESARLRERIEDGTEEAALLHIPVEEANSHAHIRGMIREFADRKDFTDAHRDDLDRLARCLEAALATDDRGPDPFLVADALASLESRDKPWDTLDSWAMQNALASLPSETIFPTLKPSARRMLSALFASDEPLDRRDLIEITSESSYRRHHKQLRAFFLVEETEDGFVAHLEPWWSSTNDERFPYHEDHPDPMPQPEGGHIKQSSPSSNPAGIILNVVDQTEYFDIPPDRYYELGKRDADWEWILSELGLEHWKPILQAYCDDWFECEQQSYSDPSPVRIGPIPSTIDDNQMSLSKAAAD